MPEVIRRVNADFVPVSVKAALLHQPGVDAEGRLMHAIGRSAPAPQGVCVLNADGQVLAWTLMFDNQPSVLEFLDHTLKRFAQHPDARQTVEAQRHMRFPSQKLADVSDPAKSESPPGHHAVGQSCPQKPSLPTGTLIARVCGRALDPEGNLSNDTTNQEHYAEDRFTVSPVLQAQLAEAFAAADTDAVKIPDAFAKLLTEYAYLGHLDMRPLRNPAGAASDLKQYELWARRDAHRPDLFRVAGRTEVEAGQQRRSDGAGFRHAVALAWEGMIELNDKQISRLLLTAHGNEQLTWDPGAPRGDNPVAHLPAGRPIDMKCGVRYGIFGESAE